jgi:cytochrome c553
MRKLLAVVILGAFVPVAGHAAAESGLGWIYPSRRPADSPDPNNVPPSKPLNKNAILTSYTGLPQAPAVISTGKPLPCMACHEANGNGHPQTADISGLSANYIIEQVHAFANKQRLSGRMVEVAKAISETDLKAVAQYYASIGPNRQQWVKTVAGSEAPKQKSNGPGRFGFHVPGGGTEPIPEGQIVMMAQDDDLERAGDQINGGFIQYVHPEQLALGERIATTGDNGRITKCDSCHGDNLKGKGDVPRLAGRLPTYLIRTMNDIKTGARRDLGTAPMVPVLAKMSDQDIVAVATYMASKSP